MVGHPEWRLWHYRLLDSKKGDTIARVGSYDGTHYWLLQENGLGMCVSQYNAPDAYMAYAGIPLANLGLGPSTKSSGNWRSYLTGTRHLALDLALGDASGRGTVVRLSDGNWTRDLALEHRFMPLRAVSGDTEIEFSGYHLYGLLWLPKQVRRASGQNWDVRIYDVSINQHRDASSVAVHFPFGTSIIYDQDVTRIYGAANAAEAELAVNNWLLYAQWPFRVPPVTQAPAPGQVQASIVGALSAAATGALAFLLLRSPLRFRLVALAAISPIASGGDGTTALLSEPASAAACTHLLTCMYGGQGFFQEDLVAFQALDDESEILHLVERTLRLRGVFTWRTTNRQDLLDTSMYPILLRLRPRPAIPYARYAILTGHNEHGYTLVDPNPYGWLRPLSRERLMDMWGGGTMLLTSPVPFKGSSPTAFRLGVAAALVIAAILLLGPSIRRCSRRLAPPLVLVFLIGCNASPPENGAPRRLSPVVLDFGTAYGLPARATVSVFNPGPAELRIVGTRASCGCTAVGIPIGSTVDAGSTRAFDVTVDFGGSVGNVRHSLSIEYGDGAIEELPITAEVLRGVFAEPRSIALRSSLPGELVQASVELKSDDGLNFQIDRAQCSIARSVQVNSESASVTLTVLNGNDIWLNTGTLVIGTSHPVVGEIRVPVTTHFSLTWKTDPAAVFVQESTDADVERTITIESLLGLPFVVHARQGEAFRGRSDLRHSRTIATGACQDSAAFDARPSLSTGRYGRHDNAGRRNHQYPRGLLPVVCIAL